ncbi:PPA1309 family protein [Gordonia sp. NPDC003425]
MGSVTDSHTDVPLGSDDLGRALRDILDYADPLGWNRPPELFALVPTAFLTAEHPELVDPDDESALSPIAQEPLDVAGGDEPYAQLEEVLATTSWPPVVAGAALVLEIVVLPPDAESDLDSAFEPLLGDPAAAESAARTAARAHPESRVARVAVGALRAGPRMALMRLQPDSTEDDAAPMKVLTHPQLAATLQEAVAATLDGD